MNRNAPLRLPAFKARESATQFEYLATNMLEAFDWSGKLPLAIRAMHVPVLYHRGTWLASQGYDPDTASIGALPFVDPDSLQPTFPTVRQFGEPAYGTKGSLLSAPAAILYNGQLRFEFASFGEFAYMDSLLQGIQGELEAKRVFTASRYDLGGNGTAGQYMLTQWIPGSSGSTPPAVNEAAFDGGNVLVLSGVTFRSFSDGPILVPQQITVRQESHLGPVPILFRVAGYLKQNCIIDIDIVSVASDFTVPAYDDPFPPFTHHDAVLIPHVTNAVSYVQAGGPYWQPPYSLESGYPIGTPDPIPQSAWRVWAFAMTGTISSLVNTIDTDRVASALEVLGRVKPRFRNIRHVLYARNPSTAPINGECASMWQNIGAQAADYGAVLRGPYGLNQDLTTVITQDILDWLAEL